ncbi:3037_t:CDS:2 [Entrophospora sp. SA101]|nr:3037_t:CDS:2 [Entrophospora sp. SA101]
MSVINSTSENSLELEEFKDYEKNDLVIDVIDDLKSFFQSSPCKCEKNDSQSCLEKIGFKNFFESSYQFNPK